MFSAFTHLICSIILFQQFNLWQMGFCHFFLLLLASPVEYKESQFLFSSKREWFIQCNEWKIKANKKQSIKCFYDNRTVVLIWFYLQCHFINVSLRCFLVIVRKYSQAIFFRCLNSIDCAFAVWKLFSKLCRWAPSYLFAIESHWIFVHQTMHRETKNVPQNAFENYDRFCY